MAIQTPLVLISGALSSLPSGDTILASDPVAQASGNAGISTGLTALASGNAGLVSASNKVPISGGYMTGQLFAASGVVVSGTLTVGLNSVATPSLVFNGDTDTGIFSPGQNQLAIATSGVERVEFGDTEVVFNDGGANYDFRIEGDSVDSLFFVDASTDRVGFKTLVPATTVDISGTFRSTGVASLGIGETTTLAELGNNAVGTKFIRIGRSAALTDSVNFQGLDPGVGAANIALQADGGSVGIGTTGPNYQLHATTSFAVGAAGFNQHLTLGNDAIQSLVLGTGNSTLKLNSAGGSVIVGTIASPANTFQVATDSAGKPSTNTWTIVSDERIKENIELADLDLCYQAVKNIPLKRFKWKDEVYNEEQVKDRRKLGWIAQDVEAVFPKAVGTSEFKYNQVFEEIIIPAVEELLDGKGNIITPAQPERIGKGELISEDVIEDCRDLNSDQIYAAMYGAIQKLMFKVETLETELAALKVT